MPTVHYNITSINRIKIILIRTTEGNRVCIVYSVTNQHTEKTFKPNEMGNKRKKKLDSRLTAAV